MAKRSSKSRGGGSKRGSKKGVPALELAERLAKGERSPCYLVVGEEAFLREHALAALRSALVGEEPGPSYAEFDGLKSELAPVLDELRTLPFLGAGHRLVIVRCAGPAGNRKGFVGEHGERLATFLNTPIDTATLVIEAGKLDGRYKATKSLRAASGVCEVDCGAFAERALLGFLRERAKHWGRSFARGADEALLEQLGGQDVPLAQIDAEVRKLASAGSGEITAHEVEALASFGSSTDGFALIARIGRGDAEGALSVLHRILRDGLVSGGGSRTREETGIAMILIPTLRWDLTRLIKGRALLDQGVKGFEIAKQLRVFRDKAHFLERVRRADLETLAARHEILRGADAQLRRSSRSVEILTDAVLRLCLSERARPALAR